MYFEKIDGNVCLTIETGMIKRKVERLANEAFEWLVAGGIVVVLISTIYYGNIAYQYLTNLF